MGKANILVVDDEINILNSLSGILTDEGYAVSTAQNGDDALKILQEKNYDLVLLDIWLPGRRDGMQTLREIKRNNSGTEVVMISGHATIDTAVRATKMGAFDFLEKPVSLSGILETVEAALRHGTNLKKKEAPEKENFNFITGCPEMEAVKEKLGSAANGSKPTLITGLPGSGKEYSAHYLHSQSAKRKDTFIKVACRRLTQASFDGLFGTADQDPMNEGSMFYKLSGTIFLENPNLLEPNLQERLARLIKAGGPNIAFVAALTLSPHDTIPMLGERLAAVFNEPAINLPPLGKRGAGITDLINSFLNDASGDFGKSGIRLSRRALAKMTSHPWPGNVKELKAVVENTVMACQSSQIEEEDISLVSPAIASAAVGHATAKIAPKNADGKAFFTQKTIGKSVVLCGLGLHSGIKTGLILSPLPANSGIIFGDISSGRQVKANVEYVQSTEYATKLTSGQVSVRTIEHIMATLNIYGITNALIKVGEEVPIMDGSAIQLCELMERAGIIEQAEPVEPIVIRERMVIGDINKKHILVEPFERLVVEYKMDYPYPVGKQTAIYDSAGGVENFKSEIAPARTFGFVEQIKKFEGKGIGEGGKLSNLILIDNERVLNTTLRYETEFSRHKVLDLIGDIYLLGRPIAAKITANMTGHTENVILVRQITAEYLHN